ncbi:uncharacterized protein LOC100647196 [Bombus terrestris]|uniref:Uncharacterized protein LOC100647196 n=1 Tax=Bombus terrestris TaxID=30195 RepID=A0A9B2MPK9_BOMTE|nr:uncharacterized protein LOC100647196 [Bombus terrestris]XP_012171439.2 uncharacterized protein LOC100647196 [Bombus terrestris]XP_012171440.2 uncharacterized protein LOC100647196 [Bombus terrestris]XP_012171442.2 uncharacterized protein LOC100647196 [Bombus terrestris]XP_048268254.1 uncharacterized protein LOC100647196 [Bombus terrestris]
MSTMSSMDPVWNEMLKIAEIQQQEYYELLAEWTLYEKDKYKYLRQNIGFAIYGPASEDKTADVVLYDKDKITNNCDLVETFYYSKKAEKTIDIIYNKILQFGEENIKAETGEKSNTKGVYYGVIFNLIFRPKNTSVNNSVHLTLKEEDEINICSTPIFKIKYSQCKEQQIWYIDIYGRVYKSWTDYKENNTLPPCTMVLPKDGFYQANTTYEITEKYSTVWLEIVYSPACNPINTFFNIADTASSVIGMTGVALGVASLFTPIGPVVLGATACSGVTGAWTMGRSIQNLVDRSSHEETINPLEDRGAFSSWLGITGSTIGIAALGGSFAITKLVQNGSNIGTATRFAYNTLILSNLGINGFGVGYQAYCIYNRYREDGTVHFSDVVSLTAHILFFGNTVLNMQFAADLIESTQGNILDNYRSTLRSKNLRRKFNHAKRNAAANNTDKIFENAEVIRYINNKQQLRLENNLGAIPTHMPTISLQNHELIICGISLLDPMKFADILFAHDKNENKYSFNKENSNAQDKLPQLKDLLLSLLKDAFLNNGNSIKYDVDQFIEILNDIRYMKNASCFLLIIFKISHALITKSSFDSEYLHKAVHFVWNYIKENFRYLDTSSINDEQLQKLLNKIIAALFEYMAVTIKELSPAFAKYMEKYGILPNNFT